MIEYEIRRLEDHRFPHGEHMQVFVRTDPNILIDVRKYFDMFSDVHTFRVDVDGDRFTFGCADNKRIDEWVLGVLKIALTPRIEDVPILLDDIGLVGVIAKHRLMVGQ